MAITRRLPWPKLLFLFVWLCLALDTNRAARVPSDQFVFPSESKPNATAIRLESRLKEIEREMAEVTRATNVNLPILKEIKKGTPRTTANDNKPESPANTTNETKNLTETQGNLSTQEIKMNENHAHPSSESKMITFGKESSSDKPAPWDHTEATNASNSTSVGIGPRIVLETSPICPKGTILTVNDHCRKIA
ncbi:Acp54A1 [Drosophila simulans]|uniref:Acp54A1 n=1 Tax=Drosophila simulans TaxID=7240 RepID=B4QAQ9_DROSI|nr:Acp54A1 [Drosophila simulans]